MICNSAGYTITNSVQSKSLFILLGAILYYEHGHFNTPLLHLDHNCRVLKKREGYELYHVCNIYS